MIGNASPMRCHFVRLVVTLVPGQAGGAVGAGPLHTQPSLPSARATHFMQPSLSLCRFPALSGGPKPLVLVGREVRLAPDTHLEAHSLAQAPELTATAQTRSWTWVRGSPQISRLHCSLPNGHLETQGCCLGSEAPWALLEAGPALGKISQWVPTKPAPCREIRSTGPPSRPEDREGSSVSQGPVSTGAQEPSAGICTERPWQPGSSKRTRAKRTDRHNYPTALH